MNTAYSSDRPTGRHPINIGQLVMGLAFLGIVGVWALIETDTVTGDDIHWLLPIPWVFAGLVGLAVTAVTGSRRYAVRQTGWVGTRAQQQPEPPPGPRAEPAAEPAPGAMVEETAPITALDDQQDPEETS